MREDLEAEYFRRDWFAQRSEEDQEKIDRAAFFSIDHPGIYPVFPDVAHVLGFLKQEIPTVFETPPAALAKAAPTNAPPSPALVRKRFAAAQRADVVDLEEADDE